MSSIEKVISNCPLCEERALHMIGEGDIQMMQCIACGYVSSPKFKGKKDNNEEYNKLSDDMKNWSKEALNRIWIPSIFTLPDCLIYPDDVNNEMKWKLANMVDIPKEEQKNYPIPGDNNKFYETMYDTDNAEVYDNFYEVMSLVNEKSKNKSKEVKIELPLLKK